MANKYVSTTGSNANSGNLGSPWLTLAYGFSHISSLDTLWVYGGDYPEALDGSTLPSGVNDGSRTIIKNVLGETPWIKSYGSGVKFVSTPRAYITFDGINCDGVNTLTFDQYSGYYVGYNSAYITVQNLTVKNYSKSDPNPRCSGITSTYTINGNSDNFRVINCIVFNSGSMGMYLAGTNQLVEYCTIYGNKGYAIQLQSNDFSYMSNNSVIRNNICHGNGLATGLGRGELYIAYGNNMQIYNNVCYRDGGGLGTSYGMLEIQAGDNIQLINNTAFGDGADYGIYVLNACTNAVVRNNINWDSVTPYTNDGTGTVHSNDLITDPDFINSAIGNLNILSTSDARDTGYNTSAILNTDIIGTIRPQNAIFDIGAYEYIVAGPPPSSRGSIIGMGFP